MASQKTIKKQNEFKHEIVIHLDAIYNFAFHFTSDPYEAEDLVQDSMMKAYRYFDRFENGTNGKAWVYSIMKNSFINKYRKQMKQPARVSFDEELEYSAAGGTSDSTPPIPDDHRPTNLIDDHVFSALNDLPEIFRLPILLCDMENYTYEEIANMLDLPIGTVRSRLHRGRNLLKNRLYEYGKKRGYEMASLN